MDGHSSLYVLHLILFMCQQNFAESCILYSSACMRTVHVNGSKPKFEGLSTHEPGGMPTGLCFGVKLCGLNMITINFHSTIFFLITCISLKVM